MFLTITAAIVVLGVLIFVHELGHFLAAKSVGIGVPRFSIGLGPVTPLSFRRGETEYVISWIPFGGYVKMASQEEADAIEALEGGEAAREFPPEKMFESKPLWARIFVILAGVTMNVLFAWVVYTTINVAYGRAEDPTTVVARFDRERLPPVAAELADIPFGTQIVRINGDSVASRNEIFEKFQDIRSERLRIDFAEPVDPVILPVSGLDGEVRAGILGAIEWYWEARVGMVEASSPAARAGLEVGDLIIGVDGDSVWGWTDLVDVIRASPERTLSLRVLRHDSAISVAATPDRVTERDPLSGEERVIGQLGIRRPATAYRVKLGLGESAVAGVERVVLDARNVWFAVKSLVLGRVSPRELGGPILIGQFAGQTARAGLEVFLGFMAFFSVNLAILNMLPIPVLDGGQFVFLVLEGVRGKPLSVNFRMRLTQFGLMILLGIMALALTNDLLRFVSP